MKGMEEEMCKISVDDSYEGIGLEAGEGCSMSTGAPEEFEPEETYIIPNPVVQDGEREEPGPPDPAPEADPQALLAAAIQEGSLPKVDQVLSNGRVEGLAFADISKEKLVGICNGSLDACPNPSHVSPLDLAATCGRREILHRMVGEAATTCPAGFEQYLKEARLSQASSVLHSLLDSGHHRLAEAVLDSGVEEERERWEERGSWEEKDRVEEDQNSVVLSLSLLRGRWGSSLESLLASGNTSLLRHPVVEASIDVQWLRLRPFLLVELCLHTLFVVTFSLLLIFGHSHHPSLQAAIGAFPHAPTLLLVLTLLFYLPILLRQIALTLHTHSRLLPRLRLLLHLLLMLLLLLTITTRPYSPQAVYPIQVNQVHLHFSAWALLLSWLTLFLRLGDLPHFSLHLHTFLTVLRKSLIFLGTIATLLIGFALTFHLILSPNTRGSRFQSPINSMIKVLAMLNGELNFDHSFTESIISVEGSVQLIFIVFFFVTNIVIINVLIGIAITALKDADFLKEDLSVMSRALLVSEVEQGLNWVEEKTGRGPPSSSLPLEAVAVRETQALGKKTGIPSVTSPAPEAYLASPWGAEGVKGAKKFPVSPRVWTSSWVRVRARREEERREEQKREEEAAALLKLQQAAGVTEGDYTSLYFKDAENQYEQIESENKYGLRSMKDSLLKELKRDLMKLVKVDKAYSEMSRKTKAVPVRPGLALGVITLQAGSKGAPPALHIQDGPGE